MDIGFILFLLLIGVVAGFFAGLIGIGGGLFYVLVYSLALSKLEIASEEELVRMIITNSIFSTFFASLSASIKQYQSKNIFPRPVLLIGLVGLFSSIAFTALISEIPFYNRKVFAIVFTLAVVPLLIKMAMPIQEGKNKLTDIPNYKYLLTGLLSGSGTALSGLGGAFIITPILNGLFAIDIKKVISISSGVIVLVAGGTSLYNLLFTSWESQIQYSYGGIVLPMVVPVIIGVMISAPFGVKFSQRISPRIIKTLFLLFCIAVIIRNAIILFEA